MNRTVFIDTSGWLPLFTAREPQQAQVTEAFARLVEERRGLITSNLVVAELHGLVTRRRGTGIGLALLDQLHTDPRYEVHFVDRTLETAAIDHWIRPFRDQRFSLTDAVSFEIMRRDGIRQAFAIDRRFSAAGFELIPGAGTDGT